MGSITLQSVTKAFGTKRAISDFTLEVKDGEFCAVVGPSGCGKSTLLRIVAGLEQPSSGHIAFGGEVVDHVPAHLRNVGMVFQNYALYPHMTVRQNLSFGLQARRVPAQEIERRVTEVASLLELEAALKVLPGALSGGQRQRVALGRALVRRPSLFLMDEPLSNLDALLRERMRLELRRMHDRAGIPTIYVTHDQTEAMTMADRIAVMHDGVLVQLGAPEEIYHRPATVFVARFFGSPPMNIVPVRRVEGPEGWAVQPSGEGFSPIPVPSRLQETAARAFDGDGSAWIGFRAESLQEQSGGHDLPLALQVEIAEELGVRAYIHGHWGSHSVSWVAASGERYTRNSIATLFVPWEDVHWFASPSGQRVGSSSGEGRLAVPCLQAQHE